MNCKITQPRLSEYIDETLSGRDTWEVDRHLAACHECTRLLNELRRTTALVQSAPRREVSTAFMSSLQTRLAHIEPRPARCAWLEAIRAAFRPRFLPAWSAGLTAIALALVFLIPRQGALITPVPDVSTSEETAAHQNVAFSATDPFADTAAANLAAHFSSHPTGDSESMD